MTAEPFETDEIAIHEVVDHLPENVEKWQEHWEQTGLIAVRVHECLEISTGAMDCFGCEEVSKFGDPSQNMEFSRNLHNRLVSCCRKHGIDVLAKCTTDSVPSPAPPTREQDQKVVMLDSPKGEDPAEVFQVEEENHEAIIDTGASRAVIGHERLGDLIKACQVQDKVSPFASETPEHSKAPLLSFSKENRWLDKSGSMWKSCQVEPRSCCPIQCCNH
jgi:hypothetical protein